MSSSLGSETDDDTQFLEPSPMTQFFCWEGQQLRAWEEAYCKILSADSPLLLVTTTGKFGARHCQVKAELLPWSRIAIDLEIRFQVCMTLEKSPRRSVSLSSLVKGVCVWLCPPDGLSRPLISFLPLLSSLVPGTHISLCAGVSSWILDTPRQPLIPQSAS